MNNIKTFEDFTGTDYKAVDESIQFGSYYYNSRTEFVEHSDDLPAKGETKYLVFAHNQVDFYGQRIRLEAGHTLGSAGTKKYIGVFDDEASATEAYKMAMKKPDGVLLSFSMGTLYAKSKFSFQYEETEGNLAKIKA